MITLAILLMASALLSCDVTPNSQTVDGLTYTLNDYKQSYSVYGMNKDASTVTIPETFNGCSNITIYSEAESQPSN